MRGPAGKGGGSHCGSSFPGRCRKHALWQPEQRQTSHFLGLSGSNLLISIQRKEESGNWKEWEVNGKNHTEVSSTV